MTETQKALARHALGLPNHMKMSYRNCYIAAVCHAQYHEWMAMVVAGDADSVATHSKFWLTVQGARAALNPGERLDPECFPEVKADQAR